MTFNWQSGVWFLALALVLPCGVAYLSVHGIATLPLEPPERPANKP